VVLHPGSHRDVLACLLNIIRLQDVLLCLEPVMEGLHSSVGHQQRSKITCFSCTAKNPTTQRVGFCYRYMELSPRLRPNLLGALHCTNQPNKQHLGPDAPVFMTTPKEFRQPTCRSTAAGTRAS
jgi:hypothetical protein